ncbi:hypothetical protein CAG69_11640 [Vibrio sp. V43_P6S15P86]|uniref:hypothetical protein n=1 Tax=Vibrio sp. V43_P6S15P86 TaxID=1938694 RepID=UPI001372D985|nr:hypothetical protein [Vibrio sp. V43_P6S15P86]
MDLDVKSLAVGSLIGVLVGGGIYGFYVKNMGEAGLDQAIGYNHLLECTSLLGSNDVEKIASFLNTLPQKQQDLEKSDAIMTATATTLSGELKLSGMGQPLAQCSKALLERYERIKS